MLSYVGGAAHGTRKEKVERTRAACAKTQTGNHVHGPLRRSGQQ